MRRLLSRRTQSATSSNAASTRAIVPRSRGLCSTHASGRTAHLFLDGDPRLTDPSVSLSENIDIARRQNAALMRVPEVEYAVAKVGRADTSTDPSPFNMTETIVHLKPHDQWRPGMTIEKLRTELDDATRLPGV